MAERDDLIVAGVEEGVKALLAGCPTAQDGNSEALLELCTVRAKVIVFFSPPLFLSSFLHFFFCWNLSTADTATVRRDACMHVPGLMQNLGRAFTSGFIYTAGFFSSKREVWDFVMATLKDEGVVKTARDSRAVKVGERPPTTCTAVCSKRADVAGNRQPSDPVCRQ